MQASKKVLNISAKNRMYRLIWRATYLIFFRFSPIPLHSWRIFILRVFGANINGRCFVYPDVKIWSPANLKMEAGSTLGPGVDCYNCALISLGYNTTVSQNATLCTGTHDPHIVMSGSSPIMPLLVAPITIEKYCWVTSGVFIHPGVTVGEGCVVGAQSVVTRSLEPWGIYSGFPAARFMDRKVAKL